MIRRFDTELNEHLLVEQPHGDYVLYADYQAAQAKIKELENTIGHWQIKSDALQWDKVQARIEKLEQANRVMRGGIEKVIQMNLTEALHRYGKSEKAEDWSCVVVLRQALNQVKENLGD